MVFVQTTVVNMKNIGENLALTSSKQLVNTSSKIKHPSRPVGPTPNKLACTTLASILKIMSVALSGQDPRH